MIFNRTKKELLDYRDYPPLKQCEERLTVLEGERTGLESISDEAMERVSEAQKALEEVGFNKTIGKETPFDVTEARERCDAVQMEADKASRALDLNRQTCERLRKGIEMFTDEGRKLAAKNLRTVYKDAVKKFGQCLKEALELNEEVERIHKLALDQFEGENPGTWDKYMRPGLPLLAWDELKPAQNGGGALHETRLSQWQKEARKYVLGFKV